MSTYGLSVKFFSQILTQFLVRQGHDKDRVVHSKFSDLVPKEIADENDPTLQRPDQVSHGLI